jgi:hypothetical protein
MNPNKDGEFVEADFTKDLPFNNIGNWKNPIFTILSNNDIGAENSNVSKPELIDAKLKLKTKLNDLKKNNPNFYNIIIDQGTFFTAFTTNTGEIFIKPIVLRKFNNNKESQTKYPLELQNQVFDENGKYIKGQAKLLGKKYSFFAFDNKKNGQSVRFLFIENDGGKLNSAFIVFSKRDSRTEYVDYYLNNLSKEDFKKLLDGELTKKPKIAKYKRDLGFSNELNLYNLTIIERIKERDVSKLLDGTYKVRNVNNPTSIFQNVGFRLKFEEKKKETGSLESIVIEESEVVIEKEDSIKSGDFVKKTLNDKIKELEILAGDKIRYSSTDGLDLKTRAWDKLKNIYKNEEDVSLIFSKFEQLNHEKIDEFDKVDLIHYLKTYFDISTYTRPLITINK